MLRTASTSSEGDARRSPNPKAQRATSPIIRPKRNVRKSVVKVPLSCSTSNTKRNHTPYQDKRIALDEAPVPAIVSPAISATNPMSGVVRVAWMTSGKWGSARAKPHVISPATSAVMATAISESKRRLRARETVTAIGLARRNSPSASRRGIRSRLRR